MVVVTEALLLLLLLAFVSAPRSLVDDGGAGGGGAATGGAAGTTGDDGFAGEAFGAAGPVTSAVTGSSPAGSMSSRLRFSSDIPALCVCVCVLANDACHVWAVVGTACVGNGQVCDIRKKNKQTRLNFPANHNEADGLASFAYILHLHPGSRVVAL